MRGMTKRWLVREARDNGRGADASTLLHRLLAARGLTDGDVVRRFCEPRLTDLHDPGLMAGIDTAARRLVDAVRQGQRIVIYGDYDVDGITATAILFHTIRTADPAARVGYYVPHRLEEGYGLNAEALRQFRSDGADVVVSVDCGISAVEEAAEARRLGLDLIVTDHHHLPAEGAALPEALAIVHPGLRSDRGEPYPFGDLCGAGVAFKLAWRFATTWCGSQRVSQALQATLIEMLPLAALGTIADVVPLVDENRVLASFGLRRIKQTTIPGLRSLIEAADLMNEQIDCEKVGFVLGPRLNACGRMGHAAEAVRMLTDAPADEALAIARRLTGLNEQRQRTERDIVEQASRLAEDAGMTGDDHRVIVLAHESWHPGVVGIACARLADRFGRPVVLMQRQGEVCKGSARSVEGYSIHNGLEACRDLLVAFGGHEMAAGLSVSTGNLEAVTERLREHANAAITAEQLTPSIEIDCDADLHELDLDTVRRIAALAPFGRGNRRPTMRVSGAVLAEAPRQMGAQGRHLSLRLRQDVNGRRQMIRTVWWRQGERASSIAPGMRLDVAVEPKVNTWNGRTTVEAELRDVRVCPDQRTQ